MNAIGCSCLVSGKTPAGALGMFWKKQDDHGVLKSSRKKCYEVSICQTASGVLMPSRTHRCHAAVRLVYPGVLVTQHKPCDPSL